MQRTVKSVPSAVTLSSKAATYLEENFRSGQFSSVESVVKFKEVWEREYQVFSEKMNMEIEERSLVENAAA